jgi:hypothetical protein
MKLITRFAVLFFFFNGFESKAETPPAKILTRINITGLKQTNERVILQYVGARQGDSAENIDPDLLRTYLQRLRIFSRVEVKLNETDGTPCLRECILTIDVKEKWSLYPIPVYVKYRDTEIGGAFLVESNFLGENKGLAAGALLSNRGWQALLGYSDPHIRYSRISTTMRYLTGRIFIEDATPSGSIVRSYTLLRHDFQSATGYQTRNGFFVGVLAGYRSAQVLDQPLIESASVMNLGVRLRYSSVTPSDFFQTGFESTLDSEKGIAFSGEDLHTVSSANALHIKTFKRQFFSALFSFQYSHYPLPLEQRLGGWQGTRTLPALLVPADKFAVTAINYQIAFLQFSWATFAGIAFFDAGVARRDGETPISFYGPGAGIRMYLTEITIPALGVDVARDIPSEQVQVSFFIGYNLQ